MKKSLNRIQIQKVLSRFINKFDRYSKNQRLFIIFLFVLMFLLIFFPVVKISSLWDLQWYSVWLISWTYFKTMLIIFISLAAILLWNISFRFKNFVITYLWFKENNSLVNFWLLWIITTAFFGITDTVSVISNATSRITITWSSKLIQILLLIWLIFTLVSVVKWAKQNSGKAKIVNIVDENLIRENQNKRVFKWLFEEEKE